MKQFLRDLGWILPISLVLGGLLALSAPGEGWWTGWLAFSAILLPGLFLLIRLWRWAGGTRTLAWVVVLAFVLRLGAGLALETVLPVAGSGSDTQKAGYVFYDAYQRDTQAWDLARSDKPIWIAFSKTYSTDQYGGLLALSAFTYRYLSPEAHRPLLIILLAALTAAAGVALAWKATGRLWGERIVKAAALILAFYPESILQGGSQMREPFLITFIAMAFLGGVEWLSGNRWAWAWLVGGFGGMLLFSPGVAIFMLVVLGGWLWMRPKATQHPRRVKPVYAVLIGTGILLLAFILLWAGLARGSLAGKSPVEVLTNWFRLSSQWDIYLLERNSGWVQKLFAEMPAWLHLPFVIGYGLAQPVLPASIADPTFWPWKVIGILRAAGWYALAPFLIYSIVAIIRTKAKQQRQPWLWLWIASWAWIVVSAVRAGADQWDNPRYRVIFLLLQAILAAAAWTHRQETHDPWLVRILGVEIIFLAFFGEWYFSRYYPSIGKLPFGSMVLAILLTSALILLGGWGWDRWKARRRGA